jgi:cell division septation protein DedD
MRKVRRLVLWSMLTGSMLATAQLSEPDINKYMALVQRGETEQVRAEMPSLLSRYPNHPGVLYLQGVVTSDGAQAARMYQSVVDNFPSSPWAADALYRVYQYYYALGLYRTAELKMAQLRKDYPNSEYVRAGAEVETAKLPEEKEETPSSVLESTGVWAPAPGREDVKDLSAVTAADSGRARRGEVQTRFSLQVGAYGSQENAHKQQLFFEHLGYPVGVQTKVKDSRSIYTVLVGVFETYDEAKARSVEITKRYNIDSFVVTR